MKIGLLVVSVIGLSVSCTTWANDLPSLGYSPGIPVKDLVAKGYRWVSVIIMDHTLVSPNRTSGKSRATTPT